MDTLIQFTHSSLLPTAERFAIAAAVGVVLTIAWISAEHESRDAVVVAEHAMQTHPQHVTLPTVQVSGRRA
jgi:hypothetical protein